MKIKAYEVLFISSPPIADPSDCPTPKDRKAKLTPIDGMFSKICVPQTIKIPVKKIYDIPNKTAER